MDGITVRSLADIAAAMQQVREAARKAHEWIAEQSSDPIAFLKSVKFEQRGYHPVTHRPINLIEQVNQTWTYMVALRATKLLLERHKDADGFRLAPGATASQELDIMSLRNGFAGAETFAATSIKSNGKLEKDLAKMAGRTDQHRYVYFASPQYPRTERLNCLEQSGVEVWSIDLTE